MSCKLEHLSLGATLEGVDIGDVWQFRGLPYGHVLERFATPVKAKLGGIVDCSDFGPLCPQQSVDVRHLLRIPPDIELPAEQYNEFKCLNLDVTCNANVPVENLRAPVVVWIHGTASACLFPFPVRFLDQRSNMAG